MKTLKFSIQINAPKEKVWHTMLDDKTYRIWTAPFNPGGSTFEGSWEKGSKIKFLGPDESGKMGGMVSEIADNRLYEFISIKHLGILKEDGSEDYESEEVKKWAPSFENYTFKEKDDVTELLVEMDASDDYQDYFDQTWPKALEKLKELAES